MGDIIEHLQNGQQERQQDWMICHACRALCRWSYYRNKCAVCGRPTLPATAEEVAGRAGVDMPEVVSSSKAGRGAR